MYAYNFVARYQSQPNASHTGEYGRAIFSHTLYLLPQLRTCSPPLGS